MMRARVIELKKNRRVAVGDSLTFLFENRDTVLFQIQEMVRTERIVDDARIQEEIDAYDVLLPGRGELSATLLRSGKRISVDDTALEQLVTSGYSLAYGARFLKRVIDEQIKLPISERWKDASNFDVVVREEGHSKEEKMAAVHYLRFSFPRDAEAILADPRQVVRLVVDHPNYRAEADVPAATRAELSADLRT